MKFAKNPILLFVAMILLWPGVAHAHLITTGLGPVYDGIGYFALSPEDVLPVIALGLFAGLRGTASGRRMLFLAPLAWLIGGEMGLHLGHEPRVPLQCISILLLGMLIATDVKLPADLVAAIGMTICAIHGYYNGAGMHPLGQAVGTLQLFGIMATIFVLVTLFAALVVWAREYWMRIVVRVAGSWIGAIGLLLLGWTLHHSSM